jgi:hypothetical protein
MTGNNSKPSRFHGSVSVKELLEKELALEVKRIDERMLAANQVLAKVLEGFPAEYAKRTESERLAGALQDLKDKELGTIRSSIENKLGKVEYEEKHRVLLEKIEELTIFKTTITTTKTLVDSKASVKAVYTSIAIAAVGIVIGIASALRSFKF